MANTIALVDDDRNILTSVAMALEAEALPCAALTDGAEALKGLTAQPADLAILDIKMPRMDGMELLGHLRKDSAMPVIFLTSKDDEVDEVLGLRMGADDYIKKPFSQRLLVERIRALAARASWRKDRHRSRAGWVSCCCRRAAARSKRRCAPCSSRSPRLFALALGVTVLLSIFLAGTIVRPLRLLAAAAEQVRRGRGPAGNPRLRCARRRDRRSLRSLCAR